MFIIWYIKNCFNEFKIKCVEEIKVMLIVCKYICRVSVYVGNVWLNVSICRLCFIVWKYICLCFIVCKCVCRLCFIVCKYIFRVSLYVGYFLLYLIYM